MTAVEVQIQAGDLRPGATRTLFPAPQVVAWDVTADGQRFLATVTQDEPGVRPLVLIQNWTRKLRP